MEFELTLRGNTEELPSLLELLKGNDGLLQISKGIEAPEPEIPTIIPWNPEDQEEFWNRISPSAKELMMHIVMNCESEYDEKPYGFWICNPDGSGHMVHLDDQEDLWEYCPKGAYCENPVNHRYESWTKEPNTHDLESHCKIPIQSLGARLANIQRHLSNPKFTNLTSPIVKLLRPGSEWGNAYTLQANWPLFVKDQWEAIYWKDGKDTF
jgi:hypothetical protein